MKESFLNNAMNRFAKFAWGVLLYNIAVVVWGAYVRASKSGAGCGEHWPDCNGQIIPLAPTMKTIVEFAHRSTSAFAGVLVIVLLVWAFRAFAKGHVARIGAVLSFIFIVIEGLIGAVLVKKGLVAENDSLARALVISIHLANTLILLAVLALTAWWATVKMSWPLQLRGNGKVAATLSACLLGVIGLSVTGAITALGATLFPVNSLAEGLARDLAPRHWLESLIWIHPIAAVFVGLALTFCVVFIGALRKGTTIAAMTRIQIGLVVLQLLCGGVNLLLHAPVWLQLVHLFLADLVWVNLVLFSVEVLAVEKSSEPIRVEKRAVAVAS